MPKISIKLVALFLLLYPSFSFSQFTTEELAQREYWEEFLKKAKVISAVQMDRKEGITRPWVFMLEKDGVTHKAIWKDCQGIQLGFLENWKWEIAAYELDKYLGMNMVPPTVEKRYWRRRGSLQLWVDSMMSLRQKNRSGVEVPAWKRLNWNRTMCKQRFFDNLIANEDRHQANLLITSDWRIILIDHSRSFRADDTHTKKLIFNKDHPDGNLIMRQLPKEMVSKLEKLDIDLLKKVTKNYLSSKERRAVMARKVLIREEIDRIIKQFGRDDVIY